MGGLGISDFLNRARDQRGGGKFLDWKNDGKVDVWLHCQAPQPDVWTHQFIVADTVKDKETGKDKNILRWPRFLSPDPEIVHKNQYFRDDGVLRVRPDLDPFLLLREWLRFADELALDQPVFEWFDPKDRRSIVWTRGELSRLVDRGRDNFGHSLDSKQEYLFVVLPLGEAELVIARESKLLGQRLAEEIVKQMEEFGEEAGDPTRTPYAFRWEAAPRNKKVNPSDMYKVYRHPRNPEPDEQTLALINSEEWPDTAPYTTPGDDDLVKIRAAFEEAAQVDLPIDALFSEDPAERAALCRPPGSGRGRAGSRQGARPPQKPAGVAAGAARGQAQAGAGKAAAAQRPAGGAGAGKAPPAGAQGRPAGTQAGQARAAVPAGRRRVDKPAPPPPPAETIPCDDCGEPLDPAATVCPKCGATYANDDAPAPEAEAAVQDQGGERDADDGGLGGDAAACWSCKQPVSDGVCTSCGIDQTDDIPYP